ncbi:MAG: hypothetical protein ACI87W_002271 [Halieaceae bacterium]|jgi:hypothetical protein
MMYKNSSGHHHADKKSILGQWRSVAVTGCTALILSLLALNANAEITQDCILEGTVDKHKAERLGRPVYVTFRNARRGDEAACTINRRSKSRRVQFTSRVDTSDIENAEHGTKVRYRYIERDDQRGSWEYIGDPNNG